MNGVKGFSTPPVKVSEMRQLIHSGQFASWVKAARIASLAMLSVATLNDKYMCLAKSLVQDDSENENDKKVIDTN